MYPAVGNRVNQTELGPSHRSMPRRAQGNGWWCLNRAPSGRGQPVTQKAASAAYAVQPWRQAERRRSRPVARQGQPAGRIRQNQVQAGRDTQNREHGNGSVSSAWNGDGRNKPKGRRGVVTVNCERVTEPERRYEPIRWRSRTPRV